MTITSCSLDALFNSPAFDLDRARKEPMLLRLLNEVTRHHLGASPEYRSIMASYSRPVEAASLAEVPFLPVRLFKRLLLKSVPDAEVFKTMISSGTTGQHPSRITLDRFTAQLQTRALVKTVQALIGTARLPMLIIDHPGVVKDRRLFSARGAGILGLANFGRDHFYALEDQTMELKLQALTEWCARHRGQTILIFGFTFMVWQYLVQALATANVKLDLDKAIVIHSGGWKKLQDEAVTDDEYKARIRNYVGAERVHGFYGMVEQTGSIYVECSKGNLHASVLADVLVRDPSDWSVLPAGREGVIQVLSVLPHSYPGHSLITEDRGVLLGEDDCGCGWRGRYFKVLGRLPRAELRGCSDTHAVKAA